MAKKMFFLLTLLGLMATAERAWACTCMPPPPPGEAANQADAVFVGRVEGIQVNNAAMLQVLALVLLGLGLGTRRRRTLSPP